MIKHKFMLIIFIILKKTIKIKQIIESFKLLMSKIRMYIKLISHHNKPMGINRQ